MTPTELKKRRRYLGGSEVAAVLGLSPFQTAAGLYDEKLGLIEPKSTSEAMEVGIFLEDGIAKLWAHRQMAKSGQAHTIRKHRPLCHPDYRFMRASPDRIIYHAADKNDAIAGLEIKCISEFSARAGGWGRSGSDDYPACYKAQCAWNRMIFDLPRWNLVALVADGRYTLKHYVYERDAAYEQTLIEAGLNFWNNHILKKVRPAEIPPKSLTAHEPQATILPPPPAWMAATHNEETKQ